MRQTIKVNHRARTKRLADMQMKMSNRGNERKTCIQTAIDRTEVRKQQQIPILRNVKL